MTAALHPTHGLPTDQQALEEMDPTREISATPENIETDNAEHREDYDTYVTETGEKIAECMESTTPEDAEIETQHN